MKGKTLVTSLALTAALATTAGVGISYAANNTEQITDPMHNLVSAISTKFNLNESDVQAVFDEQHEQMEAQHQQALADRMAQAITDGDLTQEQADTIQDKLNSIESLDDSLKDKTPEEHMTAMKAAMDELQQWAKDNNIPAEYLPMMEFHHGGPGKGMMVRQFDDGQTGTHDTFEIQVDQ